MHLLELVMSSVNFTNSTSFDLVTSYLPEPSKTKGFKPSTFLDLNDCTKSHAIIDSGKGEQITSFISYAEVVNEKNGRKLTAGHAHVPFYNDITAGVPEKNKDNKSWIQVKVRLVRC